jgi:hypothetical protein
MGIFADYAETFIRGPRGYRPQNNFAVVEIYNPTSLIIPYLMRWGEGAFWKRCSLRPGERMAHAWRYERTNENRSPIPFIRFEYNLATCIRRCQEYRLRACTSPESGVGHGKQYRFVVRDCGRVLDLVA